MNIDILKALEYASKVHRHQRRRFSEEPYINHPIRLASNSVVTSLGSDAICVAFLHDCIEDSEYPEEVDLYIKDNFNATVYEACKLLTHNKLLEDYLVYKDRILKSNNSIVLAVKYADSLDNSKYEPTMPSHWVDKCRTYLAYSGEYLTAFGVISSKTPLHPNKPKGWRGIQKSNTNFKNTSILL